MNQKVGVKTWTCENICAEDALIGWVFRWKQDSRVSIMLLLSKDRRHGSVSRAWRLGRKKLSDLPLRDAPLSECLNSIEFWSRQLPITWIRQKQCKGRLHNINLAATAATHYHMPRPMLDSEHAADAP